MVSEGIKYRTNQCFTNISRSRGSTIMFDLSKSFSKICLAIYGDKIDFFSLSTLQWFDNAKIRKKAHNLSPFFVVPTQTKNFLWRNTIVFRHIFLTGIMLTSLIGILNSLPISRIILPFTDTPHPPKNTHKSMIWMFRPAISLICTIENF